jgi:predicted transcriptional regulator
MSQSTPGTKIFRYGLTDGEHYWSKATYKQIAKYLISDLNMSEKTMERAITELVEEGIIIKQEAPKGLQTVFYKKGRTIKDNTRMFRLNMDKLASLGMDEDYFNRCLGHDSRLVIRNPDYRDTRTEARKKVSYDLTLPEIGTTIKEYNNNNPYWLYLLHEKAIKLKAIKSNSQVFYRCIIRHKYRSKKKQIKSHECMDWGVPTTKDSSFGDLRMHAFFKNNKEKDEKMNNLIAISDLKLNESMMKDGRMLGFTPDEIEKEFRMFKEYNLSPNRGTKAAAPERYSEHWFAWINRQSKYKQESIKKYGNSSKPAGYTPHEMRCSAIARSEPTRPVCTDFERARVLLGFRMVKAHDSGQMGHLKELELELHALLAEQQSKCINEEEREIVRLGGEYILAKTYARDDADAILAKKTELNDAFVARGKSQLAILETAECYR